MSDFNDPMQFGGRVIVERRAPRRELQSPATIRNNFQGRIGGQVIDISEHGCKLELANENGEIGDKVTIKLDGFESWAGVIRWANGKTVGVEFQWPLHVSVVEHLSNKRIEVALS
jgi:hypothetical protein